MSDDVATYIEYARERARWWIAKHPELRDDIMATAMLALVQAIAIQPEYIKGCISRYVENAVLQLLNDNELIIIPKSSRYDHKDKNWPKAMLVPSHELWDLKRSRDPPAWLVLHIEDVIKLLKTSKYEERVLRLRIKGFTLREIGSEFGNSKQAVKKTFNNLAERYRRLMLSHPELLRPYDNT